MTLANNTNNVIKKVAIIFFIILSFTIFYNVKADTFTPTKEFYVNDFANVLSESTKTHIMNMNVELEKKTGAQVVVVTIDTIGNNPLESYATALFRTYGIGDKKKNNGLLLLLVVDDRKSRIEVGYGLEGALTDGKTGRIQDEYMIPYYKNNNWDEGIKKGFDACLSVIQDEYNIELQGLNYLEVAEEQGNKIDTIFEILEIIIFIILLIISIKTGTFCRFAGSGFSSGGGSSFGGFSGGGGRSGGGGSSRSF